jgi:ABC-type lipoprotein export system ATPase subunit
MSEVLHRDDTPHTERDDHVIVVSGVTKRFGPTLVLDGADLTVDRGEFVALTGPSGAGKSTLLHLLAALDSQDAGTVVVNGTPVGRHITRNSSGYRREQVGMIFQLHNLIPRLTARQNIEMAMFGSRLSRRERIARADELLAAVGLGGKGGALPPKMSGGERQRVAIARGLANRPPVILADEPTGNLDDESADIVHALLRKLVDEEGVAVLAVSHDVRLNRVADRLVRLDKGRITPWSGGPVVPVEDLSPAEAAAATAASGAEAGS